MKRLVTFFLLCSAALQPCGATPSVATWDGLLQRAPQGAHQREEISLYLNTLYGDNLRRSRGPAWWLAEASARVDINLREARKGLAEGPPGPSAIADPTWKRDAANFVADFVKEEERLALLYPRSPSEIRLQRGETAGWELPDNQLIFTFDDGPDSTKTKSILSILRQRHWPALFFVTGHSLKNNAVPDYTGFTVGDHTLSHAYLPKLTDSAMHEEIGGMFKLFERAELPRPQLFRAPYGARADRELRVIKALKLRSVLWNIDSRDWDPSMQRRSGRIASRVVALALLRRHGIILMHDVQPATPTEFEKAGKALEALDYRFTDQLASATTTRWRASISSKVASGAKARSKSSKTSG